MQKTLSKTRRALAKASHLADYAGRVAQTFGAPVHFRGVKEPENDALHISDIVSDHFSQISAPDHVCRSTMSIALELLRESPARIVETGSSAWGTQSSRLWDRYVANWGGSFVTVDLRMRPVLELRSTLCRRSQAWCGDSVQFLEWWVDRNSGQQVDLIYLDSWDLDITHPLPSALHGLREYLAIEGLIGPGSLLLIDDSPSTLTHFPAHFQQAARDFQKRYGFLPGKAALVRLALQERGDVEVVAEGYQILFRFK